MFDRAICRASLLEQHLQIQTPCDLTELKSPWAERAKVKIYVKRDDLLHNVISGNKWRKLKYALLTAKDNNTQHIVSFGGGFSNHIHALAYCCKQLDIQLRAIIRGDYSNNLTPMLADIQTWGATIEYVDKLTYKRRNDQAYINQFTALHPHTMVIPEGGSGPYAVQGLADLCREIQNSAISFDHILLPVASGGTMAGVIDGFANTQTQIHGIAVLKGQGYLEQLIEDLLDGQDDSHSAIWQIDHEYHFGGYAKRPEPLLSWCEDFQQTHRIPVEPVYSGKLFYALQNKVIKGEFESGSRILVVHTGGMQGARKNPSL